MSKIKPLFQFATSENLILHDKKYQSENIWISNRWRERQIELLQKSENNDSRPQSITQFLKSEDKYFDIVDFGGGSGWLLHVLLNDEVTIGKYFNIENQNLHTYCNQKHPQYIYLNIDEFRLFPWLGENSILYLNSVLQYFENDEELLDIVEVISPMLIVIDDLTRSARDEFFAYQHYYDNKIAYRFIDQIKLVQKLYFHNYFLMAEKPYPRTISPLFDYDFEESNGYEIAETKSLFFAKKT